ncbi:MAG TPA: amidohydrolase family protein [Candidatus Nanoarchaeia archaeon]|nr:amidohydrolase family protein [Candidatus Nanoarchaeia archaeon]
MPLTHSKIKIEVSLPIWFSPLSAKALALDDKIGSFEPGKEADFLVIRDPNTLGRFNLNKKPEEILLRIIYGATKEHIEQVYVQGNRLK